MYAAQSDIVTLYGQDALVVADRDFDGNPDAASIERALASASDEVDSFLGVRFSVPLADPAPDLIKQFTVDIALYRLAASPDVQSEDHRKRYEDAVAALRRIAEGKQTIVIAPAEGDEAEETGPRPIVSGGPERLFSRDQMRGL